MLPIEEYSRKGAKMPEWLQITSLVLSVLVSGTTLFTLTCKPFRDKITGKKAENENRRETDRCLLRNNITNIYYKYAKDGEMPEYEYENLERLYNQYKKLGGNSFVDKIWNEIQGWRIYR